MIERIKEKLSHHAEELLAKHSITNEDFVVLSGYLSRLEFLAAEEKRKKQLEASEHKLRLLMDTMMGGAKDGM